MPRLTGHDRVRMRVGQPIVHRLKARGIAITQIRNLDRGAVRELLLQLQVELVNLRSL